MKVVAYIDESGTHDKMGRLRGSQVAVIAGAVAWKEQWADFCSKWQAVLNKYAAPYFHFYEWSTASAVVREKRPASKGFQQNSYREWPLSKLDEFLYELANIAGDRIIVGGWVRTDLFHQAKATRAAKGQPVPAEGDPYKHVANEFFDNLPSDILSEWPYWTEPVSIFYDRPDPQWSRAIVEAHRLHKNKDQRIAELSFADKRDQLPLQAADMIAYRFRQLAESCHAGKLPPEKIPKLDELLLRQFKLPG